MYMPGRLSAGTYYLVVRRQVVRKRLRYKRYVSRNIHVR
jgi:hypothetical protein